MADESYTNTSKPSFFARTAAPAPLSPAPKTTILFSIFSFLLSHLQSDNRHYCQYNTNQPKTHYDLRFRHNGSRTLYQCLSSTEARHLEMMVQRRHLEHPSSCTCP